MFPFSLQVFFAYFTESPSIYVITVLSAPRIFVGIIASKRIWKNITPIEHIVSIILLD